MGSWFFHTPFIIIFGELGGGKTACRAYDLSITIVTRPGKIEK